MLNLWFYFVVLVAVIGAYEYYQRQPRRRMYEAQQSIVKHSECLTRCRPMKARRFKGAA